MNDAITEARDWLRMHGDYSIECDLHGLYGCFYATGKHNGVVVTESFGMTADKHIRTVLEVLRKHAEEKP